MPIWEVPSITEEPEIFLTNWKIFRFQLKSNIENKAGKEFDFLFGYDINNGNGRKSSEILEFDKDRMVIKTKSGRTYKLDEYTGHLNQDAEYVLNTFKSYNHDKLENVIDVTKEYIAG